MKIRRELRDSPRRLEGHEEEKGFNHEWTLMDAGGRGLGSEEEGRDSPRRRGGAEKLGGGKREVESGKWEREEHPP